MLKPTTRFLNDDNGNAVIDWTVLSAGVVTLGVTIGVMIVASTQDVSTDINSSIEASEPAQSVGKSSKKEAIPQR